MGKDSGGGGDTVSTIRYAPYLESHHSTFLTAIQTRVTAAIDDSPYVGYDDLDVDVGFLGTGYILSSFPALYDIYGKFMAGLDVDVLYDQIFEDTVNGAVINNLVSDEATRLEDDLTDNSTPRFVTGMRDINSVMSSSFVVGKSIMETDRTKALNRFSTELRYRVMPIAADRWRTHLEWNKQVVMTYAEIIKLYLSAKMDETELNYSMAAKDTLWPFTVLDYQRVAVGALHGATTTSTDVEGASTAAKVIGGALSGAAAGAFIGAKIGAIGGPLGAAIGGLLGAAAGLL